MEVRPGYRQTEVGVIPGDWEISTIQELLDRGVIVGHLDGNHGELYPRSHEFKESGVPYITANDLCGHSVSFRNCKYLSEARARRFRKGIAKNGDVLFAHNATVGPTALLSTDLDYVILSTTATYFRCNSEKLLNRFLLYALQSVHFVHQYRAVMAQSTRNQVPITAQRKLSVIMPPTKAEQEAIAEALSDADAFIESLEQLLTKKCHLKQGVMQDLLTGKKRLPGFEGKPGHKQTEVGAIPEDWEVASLGQRLRRTPSYGINAPAIPFDSRFPTYLRITDITEDGRFAETTKASVEHPASAEYLLENGDIVFARTGASVGKSYLYNPKDGRLVFAGFLIRISPDPERLVPAFFSYFSQSRPFWNWVKVNSMRSGQPGINGREYASLPVALPPTKAEQEAIATILSDMDAEIAGLEAKFAKARMIKQGVMQELLIGRIRLV
jgi:type I restriction enzyme, S subunit